MPRRTTKSDSRPATVEFPTPSEVATVGAKVVGTGTPGATAVAEPPPVEVPTSPLAVAEPEENPFDRVARVRAQEQAEDRFRLVGLLQTTPMPDGVASEILTIGNKLGIEDDVLERQWRDFIPKVRTLFATASQVDRLAAEEIAARDRMESGRDECIRACTSAMIELAMLERKHRAAASRLSTSRGSVEELNKLRNGSQADLTEAVIANAPSHNGYKSSADPNIVSVADNMRHVQEQWRRDAERVSRDALMEIKHPTFRFRFANICKALDDAIDQPATDTSAVIVIKRPQEHWNMIRDFKLWWQIAAWPAANYDNPCPELEPEDRQTIPVILERSEIAWDLNKAKTIAQAYLAKPAADGQSHTISGLLAQLDTLIPTALKSDLSSAARSSLAR
jgi:hypothetical protein